MIEPRPNVDLRLYFERLSVLLVEGNALEAEIVTQILAGFKVRQVTRHGSATDARSFLSRSQVDLVFVGTCAGDTADFDEYDFVRWLRRSANEPVRTVPIVLLAGHTSELNVLRARDCGASFVVAKPIKPRVIYDRVLWLARDARMFITSDSYTGPDRRFHKLGPPPHTEGRRKDDLSLQIGDAKEPNLSQDEIDALLNAKGAIR